MIVLEKNVKNLLSEDLSVEKRGLMITAMLCKSELPSFTEAKFKSLVNYNDYKKDLVELHEKGFIKWSKYNYYKKKVQENNEESLKPVFEAISFMNNIYSRRFDYKKNSSKNLRARLKEYSLDEIKLVIANRYEVWKDDKVMEKNLNPITIFRAELFPKYLEEAQRTDVGKGVVSTDKINLNDGDEITFSIAKNFVEKDLYSFKVFHTDTYGNKKGNGILETNTGKAVRILLNIQNNLVKNGSEKEFIYIFVKK